MKWPVALKYEVPRRICSVYRIGRGIFITPLVIASHRINAEESSCGGIVVPRPQIIQT
jgi:hypothetical protein